MSLFPSVITSFNYPTTTDRLNIPSHSALENNQSSTIGQIQAVIGLDGDSSVLGTVIGDLRSPNSGGGGHVQTANKGGTGQTAYAKGDLLVAQSASVLSKLAVGTDGYFLTADSTQQSGIKWGTGAVNVQSFISSGTWTKPLVGTVAFIEVWGGGGSGGLGAGGGAGGSGTGGGGGAYNSAWFQLSVLGSTEIVSIGLGGASVTSATTSVKGNPGGTTTFGSTTSWISAFGGGAGYGSNAVNRYGGSGGNVFAVGADGGITAPNIALSPAYGYGGFPSSTVTAGLYSGGGAGADTAGWGGGSVLYGGAGGASAFTEAAQNGGGTSKFGGNGGGTSIVASNGSSSSIMGLAGSQPGGGGGGGVRATSGAGGDGKVIVRVF